MTHQPENYFNFISRKVFKPFLVLPLLSALLQILSFSPYHIWPLGFVSFLPLFILIDKEKLSVKKAFLWGAVLALAFYTFISYWLIDTIVIYGHFPSWLAFIVFIGYCLINASRFIIFFLLIYATQKMPKHRFGYLLQKRYLTWPALWTFSELAGWELFPVAGANLVSGDGWFIQFADVVGIHGMSVFWFLTNLAFYDLYKKYIARNQNVLIAKPVIVTAVLFAFFHIYGYFAQNYWTQKQKDMEKVKFAVIQGNTSLAFNEIASLDSFRFEVLRAMSAQTKEYLSELAEQGKKPDFVVWPESAIPFLSYGSHPQLRQSIYEIQNEFDVDIFFNDVDIQRNLRGRLEYFNNMWLVSSVPQFTMNYHKIKLLPFGEFIPFSNVFPMIADLIPEVSNFTPGKQKKILMSKIGAVMPSICYELMISRFTLDFFQKTGKQARIIVNGTNDTWFGDSAENLQHLELSRIRAVELRIPIIRSTNSGISAYVDVAGRTVEPAPRLSKANRYYEASVPQNSASLFAKWGYAPLHAYLAVIFALQVAGLVMKRLGKN